MAEKWCESWEKNFDSSYKALSKFKDDLKDRPVLNSITEKRFTIYLDLLSAELEEIKSRFSNSDFQTMNHLIHGEGGEEG
jgi:hypothetical protein